MKPAAVFDIKPEELDRELKPEEIAEIEKSQDAIDWSPKSEEPKKEDDKTVGDEKKAAEDKAAKEAEEATKAEDARIVALAKEQGKTVDEVKAAEAEAKKAEAGKADAQKEQERLEAIAKEEGITIDEVKAAEEADKNLIEKYKGDPKQIAKALRKENSSYGKLKAENDKLVDFKRQVEIQSRKINDKRLNEQLEAQREKLVEEYVKQNPDQENDEEPVLFERAKIAVKRALELKQEKETKELTAKADKAREELIKKLPDDYKEHVSEIREVLKAQEDDEVLADDFDVMNLAYWARGKKYTPEYVKSIEDAAYKRGKEQPEIIQKANAATSSGTRSTNQKSSLASTATDKDKQRALEVLANRSDLNDEQKIEMYMTDLKKSDNWD